MSDIQDPAKLNSKESPVDDRFDRELPDAADEKIGSANRRGVEDVEDDTLEIGHRHSDLPNREQEEEEIAVEDLEELDSDDLRQMEGPDA